MKRLFAFSFSRWWAMVLKEFLQLKRDRITFAMVVGIPLAQQTDDEKEEGPAPAKGNASASKDTASSPSSSGSSAAPLAGRIQITALPSGLP